MIQSYQDILSNLKKQIYKPIYFFFGTEAYYIDNLVKYIENNVLKEQDKAFNQQVLYGKDIDVQHLLESAMRLPMMANYQVIIVKEAQQLKNIETLLPYINRPTPSTILLLAYKHKSPDKRKVFFKELIKHKDTVALESNEVRDYQINDWINQYALSENLKIAPKAVAMLAEYLGNDLSKIVNEIDKVLLLKGKGATISEQDIEENVGISKDYNFFELSKALGNKKLENVFKIVQYFDANPKNLIFPMALTTIFNFFEKVYLSKFANHLNNKEFGSLLKIHPFIAKDYKIYAQKYSIQQIEDIFALIGIYDLKAKGIGNNSFSSVDLLKELAFKIITT